MALTGFFCTCFLLDHSVYAVVRFLSVSVHATADLGVDIVTTPLEIADSGSEAHDTVL